MTLQGLLQKDCQDIEGVELCKKVDISTKTTNKSDSNRDSRCAIWFCGRGKVRNWFEIFLKVGGICDDD